MFLVSLKNKIKNCKFIVVNICDDNNIYIKKIKENDWKGQKFLKDEEKLVSS